MLHLLDEKYVLGCFEGNMFLVTISKNEIEKQESNLDQQDNFLEEAITTEEDEKQ